MLTTDEIRLFIEQDKVSERKRLAKTGWRYYKGDHDIKQYRIFFFDAEGNLKEDKTKSNIKICHAFFRVLVDQGAQYAMSIKGDLFRSDIPELQAELDKRFNNNDEYKAQLYAAIKGAMAKGDEYVFAYKNKKGQTAFECANSLDVVEVEARFASDKKAHILYSYIDRIDKEGKKIRRIQDWDEKEVRFYVQVEDGQIKLDKDAEFNPRPHVMYKKDRGDTLYFETYGVIPFIRLDNNADRESDVLLVKDKIDSYDLMNCGLANNIQDTNEALYVVKGFQGDNLDELMLNIKNKKHLGVDENGGVEIHTVDIPYEARQIKMEIDEKNIFRFGFGVNTDALKDTHATVSVAVKSAYANLDLKTNGFDYQLKKFLRDQLDIVLDEINKESNTAYEDKDVYFDWDREFLTNALENAQIELTDAQKQQTEINTLLSLETHLGNETVIKEICDKMGLDYNDLKDKLPEPQSNDPYAASTALQAIETDDGGEPIGGGVIE